MKNSFTRREILKAATTATFAGLCGIILILLSVPLQR
jgi:hypothetical protein